MSSTDTTGVAITGIGKSAVGRALHRSAVDLAVDACLAAIADAGLTVADIDGMAAFVPDLGAASVAEVQDAIGAELEWFVGTSEGGPSQLAALWMAVEAVRSGRATHAVAFHASAEGSIRTSSGRGGSVPGTGRAMPSRAEGAQSWWLPFGAPSAANITAMYAQLHFDRYGTRRDQLGQLAVVQRANAARYPDAIYTTPITIDDYLGTRMISEPLCLLDCDAPIDFGSAVLISRADSLSGTDDARTIDLQTYTTRRHVRPSWEQTADAATMPALNDAGGDLWARTDLTPADVDVAGIYDGFSFITLAWLEALGFCGVGEAGPFLEGGHRIALDGELPINTDGGQLSSGRRHGWGYVAEVVTQLRGEADGRQVADAEVGLVASGGGVIGSAALLTRR
jgi:acetyl-CoA acetyltransferase